MHWLSNNIGCTLNCDSLHFLPVNRAIELFVEIKRSSFAYWFTFCSFFTRLFEVLMMSASWCLRIKLIWLQNWLWFISLMPLYRDCLWFNSRRKLSWFRYPLLYSNIICSITNYKILLCIYYQHWIIKCVILRILGKCSVYLVGHDCMWFASFMRIFIMLSGWITF